MLTLSDRAYMPHTRVDGVAMSDEDLAAKVHVPCPCGWRWGTTPLPSIADTSHARAGGEHRQTGWEPSIWIGDGVLDRKITYPKEQFLSRTRESTG